MFSKLFILLFVIIAFGFSADKVDAQLLLLDGETQGGSVTVGTTTYTFSLPQSSLKSAETRLQEIYTRIRNFDSTEALFPVQKNYSDISGVTFGNERTFETAAAGSAVKKCGFTEDLTIGSKGEQVFALQKFLNTYPQTRVSESGVGSVGNETDYFGTLTFNAVYAFQTQYADQILTPLGITSPTGYWGEATRAYAHTLLGC